MILTPFFPLSNRFYICNRRIFHLRGGGIGRGAVTPLRHPGKIIRLKPKEGLSAPLKHPRQNKRLKLYLF
jgi:hypothetical protein